MGMGDGASGLVRSTTQVMPRQTPPASSMTRLVSREDEKCDLITLHMPLSEDNFHIIDASAMKNMKDGVVIINTARGSLIDTKALIEALESGKVGAAGLDVIEDELGMYYYNRKSDILSKRDLYVLRGFPNVIVTPHMAFYTDQAVSDMVKHSIESCILREAGKKDPWEVV